jgi:hypothetical protein
LPPIAPIAARIQVAHIWQLHGDILPRITIAMENQAKAEAEAAAKASARSDVDARRSAPAEAS